MARLNLNRVVTSSAFSQCFSIERTTTSNVNGRTVRNTPTCIPDQYGAISAAGPNALNNFPEFQQATQAFMLVTNVRVINLAEGYTPDLIVWLGVKYRVINVDPYPQYGPGFWQVLMINNDFTPRPQ